MALLLLGLGFGATPAGAVESSPPPSSASAGDVSLKLQNAVAGGEAQLGALEPWQKRIFTEEVVSRPQRFVKDYRASGAGGLIVDVDYTSIRNYLKFFATPALLKGDAAKVLLALKAESGCARCAAAMPEMKRVAQLRMERRGLAPTWLPETELKYGGKALEEYLVRLGEEKKAPVVLLLSSEKAPIDPDDPAHADEVRFLVRAMLWVRGVSKLDGRLEILENDSIERTADRLLTDFLTELGSRLAKTQAGANQEREKLLVEVTGIRGYPRYLEVKQRLFSLSGEEVRVEERRLSKGKAVFAFFSQKPERELKRLVMALDLGHTVKVSFIETGAAAPAVEAAASNEGEL
ncbi:MAG: hypothetical protein NDJ90_02640 [Oligoflexia bacterium]|nr:hypothetical protein [Oligoflexia bacterium]